MAKQIKTISMWDVGLVSKHDSRDLKDGALKKAQDIMIDNPGEIRLMGAEDPHHIGEQSDVSVTPGYGLHAFNSDHHIKMSGTISSITDYSGTVAGTYLITTSADHGLTTGVEISINGTINYDGQNKTITVPTGVAVVSATTFYITQASVEQISATNDRTFAGASNWANAAGVNAFNAYDETTGGVLTVTSDDDGSNRQYASLDEDNWADDGGDGLAMVAGHIYRLSYTMTLTRTSGTFSVGFANDSYALQSVDAYTATASSATYTHDLTYNATNHKKIILNAATNSVFTAVFDNFSLEEVATGKTWSYNPGHDTEDLDYSEEPIQGSFRYLTLPFMGDSDKSYIHIYHETFGDLLKNRITLGKDTVEVKPVYYSIDNALRVCDANFANTNNNRVKWFGFIPKREQFKSSDDGDTGRTVDAGWYDEDSTLPPIGYWGEGNNAGDNRDLSENGSSEYFQVFRFNGDVADGSYEPWDASADTANYFMDSVPMRGLSLSMGGCGNIATAGDFQGAVGSEHEELEIGVAVVYDDEPSRQESLIVRPKSNTVLKTTGSGTAWANDMSINLSIAVRFSGDTGTAGNDFYGETNTGTGTAGGVTNEWPNRATGLAFYIVKDGFGELEDPLYLGILDFDKDLGFTDHAGNLTNWLAGNQPTNTSSSTVLLDAVACCRVNIKRVPTITYALRNGYNSSSNIQGLRAKYSTATIANRRIYVGNVHYLDGPLAGKSFEDRLLRSPVNKFDVFPHDSYIDVAVNDGDKIIALESYKDKLLQFKRNTLYIINISGEDEYLEETHRFMGIKQPWSLCKYQEGIAWANENGFYIYNGQTVQNITRDRLLDEDWAEFCGSNSEQSSPMVGYIPKDDQVIIMTSPYDEGTLSNSGNVYIFDVKTNTLTFGVNRGGIERKTNIISNLDDKCMYGVQSGANTESVDIDNQVANVLSAQAYGQVYVTQSYYHATEIAYLQFYDGAWRTCSNNFHIKADPTTYAAKLRAMEAMASAINNFKGTYRCFASAWISVEDNPDTPLYGFSIKFLTVGTGGNTSSPHFRLRKVAADADPSNNWAFTGSMSGGTAAAQQEERVSFARGDQQNVDNVLYIATLTIHEDPTFNNEGVVDNKDENNLTPVEHVCQFHLLTSDSGATGTNAELNDYFGKGDNTGVLTTPAKDTLGNPIDLGAVFEIQDHDDDGPNDGTANISYFDIRTVSAYAGRPFSLNFLISGDIILRKFDTEAEPSGNLDIVTKDFTFGNPHVRKKVYKLYLTYQAEDMGDKDSNIYVKYIIDGKDQETAANWMPMVIKGSITEYLAGATNWNKVELVPLSSNNDKLRTIYSVSFRVLGNGIVRNFKLNDMSIIYRNKSVK